MKHTATLILFILVIACAAAGFMTGKLYGYNDRPSLPGHVHRGGFEVEAEEGHYLIYSQTGEIHKMESGEWKILEICK